MQKGGIIGLLTALGFTAQFASGQLEPECNPLHASCQPNKAWSKDDYYVDFTKQHGPPSDWTIGNSETVKFTSNGAELSYAKRGDAPNMWTDFYMLGGRYDIEMKIASGKGVISSATLWSDTQDEIDYDFSGNQFGRTPFPPKDGMWAVETNVFAQGKMWDGAAAHQKDSYKPTEKFHKYSVEWDESHIHWYVDDKVVRQVHAMDTPTGFTFPQSPMKLNLGIWGAGEAGNDRQTIQWAGGEINMKGAPYTLYVKSVNITNKYPACQYKYQDKTGAIASIEKVTDGCDLSNAELRRRDYSMSPPASATSNAASSPATTQSPSTGYPTSEGYPTYPASELTSSHSYSSYSLAQSSAASSASSLASSHSASSSLAEYPTYAASSPSAKSSSTSEGYPTSKAASPSSSHLSTSSAGYPTSNAQSSSTIVHSSASSAVESPSTYPAASVSSASHLSSSVESASSTAKGVSSTASGSVEDSETSSGGYPVSPPASSTHPTSSSSSGGYSMSPPTSSSRGILSSLSSFILGTSSSASVVPSSSDAKSTYPAVSLTASGSISVSSAGTGAVSSSGSLSSSGPTSGYPTSSPSASHSGVSSSATEPANGYSMSSGSATSAKGDITSTVYSTNIYTVTSCAPTVTNCPVGKVTTELVSLSTTVSSATEAESKPATSSIVNSASTTIQPSISAKSSSVSSEAGSTTKTGASSQSHSASASTSSSASSVLSSVHSSVSSSLTMPSTYSVSSEITTSIMSTVYSTNIVTITSCAPTVTNCPVGKVTTETKSLYTTICPVTQTVLDGTTYGGSETAKEVPSTGGFTYSMSSFHPTSVEPSASPSSAILSHSSGLVNSASASSSVLVSSSVQPVASSRSSVGTSSSMQSSSSGYLMSSPVNSAGASSSILSSSAIVQNVTGSSSGSLPVASPSTYSASGPVSSSATRMTTSTVYSTNIYTITSCAPDVTDCPGKIGQVTTDLVSLYTTVCPVTASETKTRGSSSALPVASETTAPSQPISSYATQGSITPSSRVLTTSTVYTSSIYTVSSCKPGEADCSSKIGSVTTETVPLYTTICPVEETETAKAQGTTSQTASVSISKPGASQAASSYGVSSASNHPAGSSSSQAASSHATPAESSVTSAPSYPASAPSYTTSTVYSTNVYTVTSCAPGVTNCPGKGSVTTEVVAVSTTVCPVTENSKGVPGSSVPVAGGSQYTTAAITFSNTLSGSVIVVTSTISFVDTPRPTQGAGTTTSAGTAAVGSSAHITRPGTTISLGTYFTSFIEYDTITRQPPASVSTGAVPTSYYTGSSASVDVPSYQMSQASSIVGVGPSSVPVAASGAPSYPAVPPSHTTPKGLPEVSTYPASPDSDETTTMTSSLTNTHTVTQTRPDKQLSTCACDQPTVYVTVTSTVQPPYPSMYPTGTAPASAGTEGAGTYPTSKPGGIRRWLRRGHAHGEHGH